jgi:hypothetical protein
MDSVTKIRKTGQTGHGTSRKKELRELHFRTEQNEKGS